MDALAGGYRFHSIGRGSFTRFSRTHLSIREKMMGQRRDETLTQKGIKPNQIETKSVSESVKNITECILAEAKTGGYQTLIMGRCGASSTVHAFIGSIANKIINRGGDSRLPGGIEMISVS